MKIQTPQKIQAPAPVKVQTKNAGVPLVSMRVTLPTEIPKHSDAHLIEGERGIQRLDFYPDYGAVVTVDGFGVFILPAHRITAMQPYPHIMWGRGEHLDCSPDELRQLSELRAGDAP